MSAAELRSDLLAAAAARLPDDALGAVRAEARAAFGERGLPSTRDEDWKYTNLAPAVELSNAWLEALAAGKVPSPAAPASLPDIDAHRLLLADGRVDEAALARVQAAVGPGVTIRRLRERAAAISADGPLDAFNAALLADGLHIEISAGAALDKPLAFVVSGGAAAASQSRIVVEVAANADVELVEYHPGGDGDAHFSNAVVQLALAAGARTRYLRLQDGGDADVRVGKLHATLARDACLDYASFELGGGLARHDVVVDIAAAGASVHLNGLYLADGRQHVDNHTRIDHRVGPAVSRELYRGIVGGRARCVWNGKAIVHAGADGTDAEQANHNLLLSGRAEVDTKPELEIYADDVKCAHGATVGQLDRQALYYLQTRGLDREQAAHALTRAFAAEILQKQPVAALGPELAARVDARLDALLKENDS